MALPRLVHSKTGFELLQRLFQLSIAHPKARYSPAGMKHSAVIPVSMSTANVHEGQMSVVAREVHGDLTRPRDASCSPFTPQGLSCHTEDLSNDLLDALGAVLSSSLAIQDISKHILGQLL
jgi:hypothetical protein